MVVVVGLFYRLGNEGVAMLNQNVQHMQVTTQTRFDPRGNPYAITQYSFFLGQNGPFTLEYKRGEDTEQKVTADIQALCSKLVMVGALPMGSY